MIEAIIYSKLFTILNSFNPICMVASLFLCLVIQSICLRESYSKGIKIDYLCISKHENIVILCTVLVCIMLMIIMFNPLTTNIPSSEELFNRFKDNYMYLIIFSINHGLIRLISVISLGWLSIIFYGIVKRPDKYDEGDYTLINRNKFINVTLLVLLCLAIQVSLYLLIPNNEFILSNMVTE